MPTVFANGRSIVHKGDGLVNVAAAPDVCKTPSPSGPVPIPYPNIANDSALAQGTTTVKIEGNNAAIEGANLATSSGDEAGTAGGVISSKFKGKMTWIGFSPNVRLDGKGAIRFLETCMHNGNTPNTGGQPQLGICSPPEPESQVCESKDEPSITSIKLLDGGDKLAKPPIRQWANLSHDQKWVDKSVTSVDRTTQDLRFKVTFNKPGASDFRVILEPGSENVTYTGGEKGRNANFEFTQGEKNLQTQGDGTLVVQGQLEVSCAGRDTFKLIAEDKNGKIVKSAVVRVLRRVFYVELKMKGLKSIAKNLTAFKSELAKHGVVMVRLPQAQMDHIHNISNTDVPAFKAKAATAYASSQAPSKEPYVIAIAFTDHLAVKDANRTLTKAGVHVGPGKPNVTIPVTDGTDVKLLWHKLVPGEGWWVDATYLPDGGTPGVDDVAIPEAKCTAQTINPAYPEFLGKVSVNVTGLPAGTGTIKLKVHWVNRMRAGISLGGGNAICLCTRAWWQNITTAEQNQTAVHEVGHTLGMVTDGSGNKPDRTATQYDGKGHVGSHCHHGLAVLPSYSNVKGDCVMFGSTNGKSAFCENCAPAVKKMDLSAGWSRF